MLKSHLIFLLLMVSGLIYGQNCETDIYVDSTSGPGFTLYTADSASNIAVFYHWSTGSTTPTINVSAPGNYCVTVTFVNGCTATDCIDFSDQTPPLICDIQMFGLHGSNGFYQISTFPTDFQFPIVSYSWNTGSNGPVLNVTEPGTYCVTTTNSEGCTASDCYNVCPIDSAWVHVSLGQDSSSIAYPAELYVIEYDTAQGGVLTAIDTLLTDAFGNVLITDLPDGPYLLKAALLPGAPNYNDYLPTYYLGELIWSDATPLNPLSRPDYWTGACFVPYFYLPLIEGQNPGGPNFIGGLVSQGANFTGHDNEPEVLGEGDPYPGATIVLFTFDSIPVAAAVTDANGAFSFDNLENGPYILVLDIPGLAPVSVTICIGCIIPDLTILNFKVDENSIALDVQNLENELVVKAFPNPATDYLWVETNAGARITLRNTSGGTVSQTTAAGARARLNLKDVPAGIYFLEVQEGSRIGVLKVAH